MVSKDDFIMFLQAEMVAAVIVIILSSFGGLEFDIVTVLLTLFIGVGLFIWAKVLE